MQMPAAVESVGVSEGQSQSQLAVTEPIPGLKLSNPGREAEVLSGILKITQHAMFMRRRRS